MKRSQTSNPQRNKILKKDELEAMVNEDSDGVEENNKLNSTFDSDDDCQRFSARSKSHSNLIPISLDYGSGNFWTFEISIL